MAQQQNGTDHPDSHLHPHATGPAAATVAAHSSPADLKLYSGWFCPFVQRVWAVLQEKSIPYEYIEVNPYHKPASLLALNPRGLVPTLEYNAQPLYESTVILEFLEDAYPSSARSLRPESVYDRAKGRIWTDFVTTRIIPAFHRFLQWQPMSDTPGLAAARAEFLAKLKEFTSAMDPQGPYFFGAEPMLIDFVLAPWAMRLWVFDHWKGGLGIPAEDGGAEDAQVWPRWRKWLAAVEQRKSLQETMSEREFYMPIYDRYAENRAMSELAKATRAGRGVP